MDKIEAYRREHALCPKCQKKDYWQTLCGIKTQPELRDDNDVHCACGWIGIVHDLVSQLTLEKDEYEKTSPHL